MTAVEARAPVVVEPAPVVAARAPAARRRPVASALVGDAAAAAAGLVAGGGAVAARGAGPALAYAVVAALLWPAAARLAGAQERRPLEPPWRAAGRALAAAAVLCGVIATGGVFGDPAAARSALVVTVPVTALVGAAVRWARARQVRTALVVGPADAVAAAVRRLRAFPRLRLPGCCLAGSAPGRDLVAGVPVLGGLGDVTTWRAAVGADLVLLAGDVPARELRALHWAMEGSGADLAVLPGLSDLAAPRLRLDRPAGEPMLVLAVPGASHAGRCAKRVVDVVGAATGLLVTAPLLLVIAGLVRCTSRGPVLYRQLRVGEGGRPFTLVKFRSMVDGADRQRDALAGLDANWSGPLFKARRDPRVTPVGRLLRRSSLDELPQLVNVLLGTMSLVGPRPPLPEEVARYEPHVCRRLRVPPGVTGLWQVSGRSDLSWEESVRLDLYYADNWSLGLDLAILVRTVAAVVRSRGAY